MIPDSIVLAAVALSILAFPIWWGHEPKEEQP